MPSISNKENRPGTPGEAGTTSQSGLGRDPLEVSLAHAGMMEHALTSSALEIERNPFAKEIALPSIGRSQAEAALAVIDGLYDVVEKEPENIGAKRELSAALQKIGLGSDALIQLREVVRIEPHETRNHLHLASLLLKQKLPQEACNVLVEVEKKDPSNSDIHLLLAGCHRALGDSQQELISVRRAVELDPASSKALECLTACLMERKEYSEALEVILRRIEKNPLDAAAWGERGAVTFALGDVRSARDAYTEAFRLAPDNEGYALGGASLSTLSTGSVFSRLTSLVKYMIGKA